MNAIQNLLVKIIRILALSSSLDSMAHGGTVSALSLYNRILLWFSTNGLKSIMSSKASFKTCHFQMLKTTALSNWKKKHLLTHYPYHF